MEKSKFRQDHPPPQDLKMASETRFKRCDRLDRKELEICVGVRSVSLCDLST